jgi:hypothetical protein
MVQRRSRGKERALKKARARLICIMAGAVLAALLVPLAVRAWSASQRISSNEAAYGEGMYRYPALAARGSKVYAMWSRRVGSSGDQTDPYYDKSFDNGASWGTDTNIQSSPDTETLAPLDLSIDSDDRVHFVWAEKAGSSLPYIYTLYYSYTIGSAIQTITQTTQIVTQPAIEVSSSDVHVVWSQGGVSSDIWHESKSIGLGDWSSSTPKNLHPSSSTASYHPDIAVDDNDNLHVVWEENVDSGTILYQKKDSGGWLTDPITLSTGIANSHRSAIAVYSDTVNVVWCEFKDFGTQYVRFRQSTDGGNTWDPSSERISGDALAVNLAVSTYLLPAITVGSNGKIHVAFNGQSDNPAEDIHYVSRPEGESWSSRRNVTNNNNNTTIPAIATGGEYGHLIWAEKWFGSLYDVYYSRGIVGGEDVYLPLIMKSH